MQDRLPLYPGRVVLTPVSGQANTYDMTRADQPTQEGTPLNKASLLKDATAALFGLGSNAVPDDVLSVIRGPGAITEKVYLASSVVAGQVVDIIPPSELTPLENVQVGTVITLNESGVPPGTNIAITSGTPSQAIALQSGNAGDTIEVIYAGTVFVDWVTQGQQITSNGVKGAGILDGVLQVAGENSPGTKIVTGSYVGTGQSGPSNPNILDFDEPPKIIFIVPEINIDSYSMGILFPPYGAKTFIFGPSIQSFYRGLTVSLSGGTVKYYSSEDYFSQLNNSGKVFHYYALF